MSRPDENCLVSNGHGKTYKEDICLFRAVAVQLYGWAELETNSTKLFIDFLYDSGHDTFNLKGVSMDHLVFD